MAIETKIISAGGTASVPPSRLAGVEGTATNRGHTFSDTDYTEATAPFVAGHLLSSTGAVVYIDYGS